MEGWGGCLGWVMVVVPGILGHGACKGASQGT